EMEIPVCYGGEHGPDLEEAARAAGLTPEALVALHGAPGSMVYMLGFAPGHSYIGVHDARLDLPRRATPRTAVPAGSVAIANRQTVIYPARLPGGWNIIGATPLNLFDPGREPAALLQPGDRIRFVPIDAAEFDRLREAQ
ncbi:5-oxoprolinase subunit PxpB, partial [Bordetella pertussis]